MCEPNLAGEFREKDIPESILSTSSAYYLRSKLADCRGEDWKGIAGYLVCSGMACRFAP